jgi:hypothetical protein
MCWDYTVRTVTTWLFEDIDSRFFGLVHFFVPPRQCKTVWGFDAEDRGPLPKICLRGVVRKLTIPTTGLLSTRAARNAGK